jgi:chondroitin synthase
MNNESHELLKKNLISDAKNAFLSSDYYDCVKKYELAIRQYPELKETLDFVVGALNQKYSVFKFDKSYDVPPKKVPERPVNFPEWLKLPELKGVANDYTFIEKESEAYWSSTKVYTLPVSVVVPVYNRSIEVDFVLAGLTHQTYPRNLIEVVIADDGSQEDISKVYKKYEKYFRVKYCRQEDVGYRLAEVRNLGIKTASYDSIIILDSDAIPNPELVEKYMKYFHVSRNVAMYGLRHYVSVADISVDDYLKDPVLVHNAPKIKSENTVAAHLTNDGVSVDWRAELLIKSNNAKNENLPYRFLVGANCAFSRELFDKVGGYSVDFNSWGFEDQEFGYRLLCNGAYFIPLMDNYVYHQEPLSGKNDTDRKLGESKTKLIFIEKCPFIYRKHSDKTTEFETPLVSIYVPLFNREKYIAECLQSALEQTVKDLEIVVCDDGSTDNSIQVINRYFRNNKRIRVISQKNAGIGASSNTAVRNCKGFYIGQLDADDVLKKDAVEKCLEVMEKDYSLSLVYGTTEYIDSESNVMSPGWNWPYFSREYLLTKMIVHHFRFFRRRDFMRTSGFSESIKNAVDYDMMLKLSEVGRVIHLNRVLYQYRRHGTMTTVMDNDAQNLNNFIVINEALKRLNLSNVLAIPDGDVGARAVGFSNII